MRRPGFAEDAKNIAVIGVSALAALLGTTALARLGGVWAGAGFPPPPSPPAVWLNPSADFPVDGFEVREPLSGTNRIYGVVRTKDGASYEGFVRWDRNEGSWSDLLDLRKLDHGVTGLSGIRFGHVRKINSLGRNHAIFVLRSGQEIGMQGLSSDLGGPLMRGIVVTHREMGNVKLDWDDVGSVEFHTAPAGTAPPGNRLHGTLTTASGMAFTGYLAWDVDEIHSMDELDGDAHGRRHEIPFGAVASIQRAGRGAADVTLHSGERIRLSGTNDVNSGNRGIAVSDPGLGQVKVEWGDFASVRFHEAAAEEAFGDYDGGRALRGVVITTAGESLRGTVRWDQDEYRDWEMLNGEAGGAEFHVEFSKIARIAKLDGDGSEVLLRDGRSFVLHGSNDVDAGNRGVVVESDGAVHRVEWADFQELRLER